MSTYKALAAVGQAIVNLLKDASRMEFPEAEFKLFQPADFAAKRKQIEGASVWLYQVETDNLPRNRPPGRNPGGSSQIPAIPLNARFLITPWGNNPEQQYRLLGWIILVLNKNPILPAGLLNQTAPNEVIFSPDEKVKLVIEPLPLPELSMLVQSLRQPGAIPSLSYRAALVLGGEQVQKAT